MRPLRRLVLVPTAEPLPMMPTASYLSPAGVLTVLGPVVGVVILSLLVGAYSAGHRAGLHEATVSQLPQRAALLSALSDSVEQALMPYLPTARAVWVSQ